ncbi:MAG: dihydroorotate dehydrogenase electron transfer subunit [Bacteroidales bacterium]|nr:dihydroorotate dehydrogenase electron transfer subunit [Candidatus Hennigimonas equi]
MLQSKFIIKNNALIADQTYRLDLLGDSGAMERGGQFADVAIDGFYLRRPLAVTEWNEEGISLIYKVIGEGTKKLSTMTPGAALDILTGLGNGFDAGLCRKRALIVSGGIGASPTFTLAKDLIVAGRQVNVILGFNSADECILADEYKALGARVELTTVDGSTGTKGFVTALLPEMSEGCDHFYTCGPKVMMKAVCETLTDIDGEASMEERMGCGCGICYGCTCHTSDGPRRVCADGPVFPKDKIIW